MPKLTCAIIQGADNCMGKWFSLRRSDRPKASLLWQMIFQFMKFCCRESFFGDRQGILFSYRFTST